jgi:hypothetical protein
MVTLAPYVAGLLGDVAPIVTVVAALAVLMAAIKNNSRVVRLPQLLRMLVRVVTASLGIAVNVDCLSNIFFLFPPGLCRHFVSVLWVRQVEKSFCGLRFWRFTENAVAVSALLPMENGVGYQLGVERALVGGSDEQMDRGETRRLAAKAGRLVLLLLFSEVEPNSRAFVALDSVADERPDASRLEDQTAGRHNIRMAGKRVGRQTERHAGHAYVGRSHLQSHLFSTASQK